MYQCSHAVVLCPASRRFAQRRPCKRGPTKHRRSGGDTAHRWRGAGGGCNSPPTLRPVPGTAPGWATGADGAKRRRTSTLSFCEVRRRFSQNTRLHLVGAHGLTVHSPGLALPVGFTQLNSVSSTTPSVLATDAMLRAAVNQPHSLLLEFERVLCA